MANKLFKSFFALAMLVGSALGFVACENGGDDVVANPTVEVSTTSLNFTQEEDSQSVEIKANSDWKVSEVKADWVTVTPMAGNGDGAITIAVAANDTGKSREVVVKVYSMHKLYGEWSSVKIKVAQSASDEAPVTEEFIYGDDFDGKDATKTYGSGEQWPTIKEFPEFANPTGSASANVTYDGNNTSVRNNSNSDGTHSDYAGSGKNNIFFGSSANFQINNIALDAAHKGYKLTFGTEKYSQDHGSVFTNSEFHVLLSKDGADWTEIEYTFAGTAEGRWNVATAEFTLAEVPSNLYIKFVADVASSYRLDDVKLYVGNGGQAVSLTGDGQTPDGDDGDDDNTDTPVTGEVLYKDTFDGEAAAEGSKGWPYVNDFPNMKNATGSASANVSYEGYNATVRNNANSDGTYSDYAGSGVNNIFFGKDNAWFMIKELTLNSSHKNLVMTFGTEKYSKTLGSVFTPSEFIVSLSADGESWTNIDYTYAGTVEGRWNVATANFTLKAVPAKLYIKFTATAESSYRLDDVTLAVGAGGQTVDLGAGVVDDGNDDGGNDDGRDEDDDQDAPVAGSAFYKDNFDGTAATKSGNYWPNVTDFPQMKNASGSAAANVSYDGYNTSVRNNSNSNGEYSDYAGSGVNNIFFGKDNAWFMIKDLALQSSQKNLTLTFGTEKYSQTLGSVFTPSEFIVSLSADGESWTNIDYTYAGTVEGRWNVATANFTLKAVPAKLYIKFSSTVDSAYRLDDVTLAAGNGGQTIDLNAGTTTPEPEPTPDPDPTPEPEPTPDPDPTPTPGDGASATIYFNDVANRTEFDTKHQTWKQNGITVTNNKGASTSNVADYSNPARFYKSSELIVECEKAMTKIEFACNNADYATALQSSLGNDTPLTVDGKNVVISLSSASTSFTVASLTGGQVRMDSITVYYAE